MIPNVDVVRFIKKERLPHRALVETDFRTPMNRSTRINTIQSIKYLLAVKWSQMKLYIAVLCRYIYSSEYKQHVRWKIIHFALNILEIFFVNKKVIRKLQKRQDKAILQQLSHTSDCGCCYGISIVDFTIHMKRYLNQMEFDLLH